MKNQLTIKNVEIKPTQVVAVQDKVSIVELYKKGAVSQTVLVANEFVHQFGEITVIGLAEEFDYTVRISNYDATTKTSQNEDKTISGAELVSKLVRVGYKVRTPRADHGTAIL